MQSLIKMSRLETGIFVLHMEEMRLSDTIAGAVSMILAEAEKKNIQLLADCDSTLYASLFSLVLMPLKSQS